MKNFSLKTVTALVSLLPYILVFLATLTHPLDLDLGWHLRFGKDIVQTGQMIYENTYSTEMTGYHWFNSSWLLDIFRYFFWGISGFWGMAIVGSILAVAIYFVIAKSLKLSFYEQSILFPLLLWVENPLFQHSFRAQEVSLLGIALVYWILMAYQRGQRKLIYILIPFFLLWANIHAQFVLGIGILIVWTFIFLTQNISKGLNKHLFPLCFTLIASFLVTLINPYGIQVYQESLTHSGNPAIQFILEFIQPQMFSEVWWNQIVWGCLLLGGIFLIWKKKMLQQYLPYLVIGIPFYIVSFFMLRYHWPMYVLTLPIVALLIKRTKPKNTRLGYTISIVVLTASFIYVCVFLIPHRNLTNMGWETYANINDISITGAKKLKDMKNPGRIYTDYNYGGFLIWNYPQVKPAVDGRMPLWTDASGYSAFIRYIMLENNRSYVELAPFDTYFIRNTRPLMYQMEKLREKKKVKLLFKDEHASIYTRL